MAKRVKLGSVSEVPRNSMKTFEVEGKEVLVANVGGTFHAMGAICTHAEWDLSEGTLEGTKITCAGHGSVWELKTGEAEFVRPLPTLPIHRVVVERDDLYVTLEESPP